MRVREIAEETGAQATQNVLRKSLRHVNINYRSGWFFVTSQVSYNKSVFGAIVGSDCVLNELGRKVWSYWRALPSKYPELEVFESVLMPNHFHALLRIHDRPTNRKHHLGFLMSRFKGGAGFIYGKMRREGLVEDIGEHLWQYDYWDDLVTSEREFTEQAKYIRENPANWSRDRYGPCTAYSHGDTGLLNAPRIAFVASREFPVADLRFRRLEWGPVRAEARHPDARGGVAVRAEARHPDIGVGGFSRQGDFPERAHSDPVVISTFTSPQEREVLRRALTRGRRVIQVVPQGIPPEERLPAGLLKACQEGRALLISPQAPGSRLNKKAATWCNEYVLRNADEVWCGSLAANGMLSTMIHELAKVRRGGAG